ncbi:hypothetical protein DH2020_044847 [Rehmannia glutinosa]|uniref:O-acyltransferase WSD1 C-terminal domain-containing protein n=1 Tax=Rehmannia glutinosa TaxID=99300 RepID=A0ABR0UGI8_REHGL
MEETAERDQPLTPAGRLFLQPGMDQVINCAIAVDSPLDVDAIKAEVRSSIMLKHPRFCSLMVRDSCGREHWRKTQVDVDRHVIVRHHPLSDLDPSISDEDAVNDFIADLSVSSPLPTDKPLRADDPAQRPTIGGVGSASAAPNRRRWSVLALVKVVWFTLIYVLEFVLRVLWLKDKTTAVRRGWGGALAAEVGVGEFRLDDMKIVKRVVADATINDVLFGIISCGLSRYLDIRSPKGKDHALPEGLRMTGVAMVNLRSQAGLQDMSKLMNSNSGSQWGNKFECFSYLFIIIEAITMHMVSYAGIADLQILVAKEIIPDPKVLAKCFEDALLEMKEIAEAASKS